MAIHIQLTKENFPCYQAILIKSGLDLYVKSEGRIIPNRAYTITRMIKMASQLTGKPYKRCMAGYKLAIVDLQEAINQFNSGKDS